MAKGSVKRQKVVFTVTETEGDGIKSDITFEPSMKRFDRQGIPIPKAALVGLRLMALARSEGFWQEMTKPLQRQSGIVEPDQRIIITDKI